MNQRGNSLVGILAAVAIVILATLYFAVGPGVKGQQSARADGKGNTVIGQSVYRAKDSKCMNYLGQLRQSITIQSDPVDGTKPTRLEDTRLGNEFYSCPVGKEPYQYDAESGRVWCEHKGHEQY